MKIILFLHILIPYFILAQNLTVSISADKPVYSKSYGRNIDDNNIKLTYTLHNNTGDSVLIKFEPFFELTYAGNDYYGLSHCFRMYPLKINGEIIKRQFIYDTFNSFVTVSPNDSITYEGEFDIGWPCRGAPPSDDWELNIKYQRVINREDNFYLIASRYTDYTSKEFLKAWEGKLSSNTINIKIIRN